MRHLGVLSTLVALLFCAVAQAQPAGESTDLARRRYETGKWLYQHARYQEALTEFLAAREVSPRPELDYNIGLCQEHLDHPAEAAEAFRRFVEARPSDPESAEVRVHIANLDARLLASRPARPIRRGLALGLGLGGIGIALVGAATGSVVLARRDEASSYDQNRALAITTDVLLPVGGVLALSGLVVYLVDRRAPRR
jgi:tetratricopeptide (TPR) repeat protein